jgi:hypothetical protein
MLTAAIRCRTIFKRIIHFYEEKLNIDSTKSKNAILKSMAMELAETAFSVPKIITKRLMAPTFFADCGRVGLD